MARTVTGWENFLLLHYFNWWIINAIYWERCHRHERLTCLRSQIPSGAAKGTMHLSLSAPRYTKHRARCVETCASQSSVPASVAPLEQGAGAAQGLMCSATHSVLGHSMGRGHGSASSQRNLWMELPVERQAPSKQNKSYMFLDSLGISVALDNVLIVSLCRTDTQNMISMTSSPFWHEVVTC